MKPIIKAKTTLLWILGPMILLLGCASTKTSKFNSLSVPMGMDKKEVLAKFGSPYKSGYFKDLNQTIHEDWFYKESIYVDGWVEVTNVLHFENGKIVSLEPLREIHKYSQDMKQKIDVQTSEKKL